MINLNPSVPLIDILPETVSQSDEKGDNTPYIDDFSQLIAQFSDESLPEEETLSIQETDANDTVLTSVNSEIPDLSLEPDTINALAKDNSQTTQEEDKRDDINDIALPWIAIASYLTPENNAEPKVLEDDTIKSFTNTEITTTSCSEDSGASDQFVVADNEGSKEKSLFMADEKEKNQTELTDAFIENNPELDVSLNDAPHEQNSLASSTPENIKTDNFPMSGLITLKNQTVNDTVQGLTRQFEITQSIGEPEWGNHFNQQIIWLGQQQIDNAVIRIHPEELGPLEVKLHWVDDNIDINIQATNQPIGRLLEQSMPLLKEMMLEQGLTLSQVTIETSTNANQQHHSQQNSKSDNEPSEQLLMSQETPVFIRKSQGIIDYFA